MTLIDRYITKSVYSSIGMITLVLMGLQLFILFIGQMNDIGRGDYSMMETLIFVLYQLPYQMCLFFPIISLLGSLLGLGVLAEHRELVIMQTCGQSIMQIAWIVLKSALFIALFIAIINETIAPKMVYLANNRKMQDISQGQSLRTTEGVWVRYHNDFIFIQNINPDSSLDNVFQFHFDIDHQLVFSRKINRIIQQNGHWVAEHIEQTDLFKSETKTRVIEKAHWDASVNPVLLKLSIHDPDEMNMIELYRYIHEGNKNHQTSIRTQVTFYQRLLQPIATLVMMMLAIPFIFGPLRSSSMGSKFLVGATVGFSFYVLNKVFGLLGPLIQMPSILVAPTPIIICTLLGVYLMRKSR